MAHHGDGHQPQQLYPLLGASALWRSCKRICERRPVDLWLTAYFSMSHRDNGDRPQLLPPLLGPSTLYTDQWCYRKLVCDTRP
jgi:hypothetical protein